MVRNAERTRTSILDAAEKLILDRGFAGAGVDRIIAEAGSTKGGFFHHFPSKQALADALIQRWVQGDLSHLDEKLSRAERLVDDPLQQMLLFLGFFIEEAEQYQGQALPGCLYAAYVYEVQQLSPTASGALAEGMLTWRRRLRAKLAETTASHPPVVDIDPDVLADAVTVVFEGSFVVSRAVRDPDILRQQLTLHRNILRAVFAAQPGGTNTG